MQRGYSPVAAVTGGGAEVWRCWHANVSWRRRGGAELVPKVVSCLGLARTNAAASGE